MSTSELLQRLHSLPAGAELDWVSVRREVAAEYDHATPADRATLVSECVDAVGNVSPEALRAVTEREITAGRMAADDKLRRLALDGPEAFQPLPEPPRTGLHWLFSRGRRNK